MQQLDDSSKSDGVVDSGLWHHQTTETVRWSDVDRLGHVNHLAYLRWCEDVRNEHAVKAGLPEPGSGQYSQVVVSMTVDYLAPINFGAIVQVKMRIEKIGKSSLRSITEICEPSGRTCARVSTTTVMCFDASGQKRLWTEAEKSILMAPISN
jgi:acyl-CoA thioester hydrolase